MGVLVIAEAGSCHDNKLENAYRLIDKAKESGANAVKFQYWSNSGALAARRGIPGAEPKYEAFRLPQSWLLKLHDYCNDVGIEFMCSTFLISDLAVIEPLVRRFKVSAFESGWDEFLKHHSQYDKPLIVSINPGHRPCQSATNLHCVSKYPTPVEDIQLGLIRALGGFSDHTQSASMGGYAVTAGATTIEKHLRLATTEDTNPDYPHSLEPGMFRKYVLDVRWAEKLL